MIAGWLLLCSLVAGTPSPVGSPEPEGVTLTDEVGEVAALALPLTDHTGQSRTLRSMLEPDEPLLLVLAYYRCPMLCGLTVDGVADALQEIGWEPDRFTVATVSFDPRDGPADAERARVRALDRWGVPTQTEAWPFFVGEEEDVRRLADSLGFGYRYDEATDQYAHPSAVFILAPDGTLSRVLPGVQTPSLDLRMSMLDASKGDVGSFTEQVLSTCYRYDPSTRRYGFYVFGFLRLAAFVLLATVGVGLALLIRADIRRSRALREETEA